MTRTRMRFGSDFAMMAVSGVMALLGGCADTSDKGPSMEQRQDAAIKDPFSYGPDVPTAGARRTPPPVAEPPPKDDSLKSEWQRFWNP